MPGRLEGDGGYLDRCSLELELENLAEVKFGSIENTAQIRWDVRK